MRFLPWSLARLGRAGADRVVIAMALVLALPSLLSPFFIDEHVQALKWKAALEQQSGISSILNDYFVFSNEGLNRQEMERGLGAWWTAPDLKVSFWRPLSAATHVVDQLLWPENIALMHVHTLLWFLALLLALAALYRRFLPPGLGCLALALYAWDDARGMTFAWIANRHALIAALLGICTLLVHDRWRRDGWRPGAWLGPVLLALTLLSSEMGVATTGFLLGHALFVDQGSRLRRLARLGPHAAVLGLWQAGYALAGYGVAASGAYLNPMHEPLTYLAMLVQRAPVLALAQLTPVSADFWGMYPTPVKIGVFVLALALLAGIARMARPLLTGGSSLFWLVGAALSLMLVCATGPQDRNLTLVGLGVAPVLATVLDGVLAGPPAVRWQRHLAGALAMFNLVVAPLLLPLKCLAILGIVHMFAPVDASIPREPAVRGKTLVLVWTNMEPAVYYSWSLRDHEGTPRPGRTRILATSAKDVSITRLDEVSLRLQAHDGFFASEVSRVLRGASRPFSKGEVVQLSNMRATVTEITTDGRPVSVEFRFSNTLDSPEWLWMRACRTGLVIWSPPKVGETVVLPTRRCES